MLPMAPPHLHVIVASLVLLSGCAESGLTPVEADLNVDGMLTFADTTVGATRTSPLRLFNPTRARQRWGVTIEAPFAAQHDIELEAGATGTRDVSFSPDAPESVHGRLVLRSALTRVEVLLRGRGIDPITCEGDSPCTSGVFDETARRCVQVPVPDATACETACIPTGRVRRRQMPRHGHRL